MILTTISLLILFIILGFPIAISLMVVSLIYFYLSGIPINVIIQQMLKGTSSFVLIAIPLYIFAGQLMNMGGVTQRIIRFCNALFGGIRGGLAQVNIFSNMIFSGVSGEAVADTAALGSVLIPAMKKQGYTKEFSAGVTAGAAIAGPIIPPSVPLVICASLAGVSVGKMLLGGIGPGILFTIFSMIFTHFLAVKRNFPKSQRADLKELRDSFIDAVWALLAPVIIIGGMVFGVVTPTEAGVIAVFYVMFIGFFVYKELKFKEVMKQAWETASTTGAIMFILALANVYTYILTREQMGEILVRFMFGLTDNVLVLLLLVLIAGLIVGMFLSTTAGLLLFVPILGPLADQIGIDPILFYVLVTITLCIGTLTPPVAINVFLAAQIAGASPEKVFVEVFPYIIILLLIIVLSFFIPEIVLWLPNLQFGANS